MKAEIISVGTELLIGSILNTNQQYLARQFASLGIDVHRCVSVGDNPARIAEAVGDALLRVDLAVLTGGLGPTADDVTLASAARVCGWKLVRHAPTFRSIFRFVRSRGRRVTDQISAQALVPVGAKVFPNDFGTAPGILAEANPGKYALLLPGPPREMKPMFERYVAAALNRLSGSNRGVFLTRSLKFYARPESDIAGRVDDLLRLKPPTTVGIYARPGEVELRAMSKAPSRSSAALSLKRIESTVRKRFPGEIILSDDESLESFAGHLLRASRKTLACAESCTGGLAGDLITNAPGSSDYFLGSAVCYHNGAKQKILGVSPATLRANGAVSAQTAMEMALGARRAYGSDYALSITGIAGPAAPQSKKPVGLVYVAVAGSRARPLIRRYHFIGSRPDVKAKAAQAALLLLVRVLLRDSGKKTNENLQDDVCV